MSSEAAVPISPLTTTSASKPVQKTTSASSSSISKPRYGTKWINVEPKHVASNLSATVMNSTAKPAVGAEKTNGKVENVQVSEKRRRKRKLTAEEEEMRAATAYEISKALASDHLMVLYPDVDTPFEDEIDVVNRLLPYHIFQQPKDALDRMRGIKGKGKASEAEMIREEIRDTRFAVQCHERLRHLEKRLRIGRIRQGKHPAPHGQAIQLSQYVLEGDRVETTTLEQQLSEARTERDKLARAKRAAAAPSTSSNATAAGASASAKNSSTFVNYTGYATPGQYQYGSQPSQTYNYHYSTYTYPYGQTLPYPTAPQPTGSNAYFANPLAAAQSMSHLFPSAKPPPASGGCSGASTPAGAGKAATTTASTATTSAGTSSAAQAASTSTATKSNAPPPTSVPIQLPIASLESLKALGIHPVPKADIPPPPHPSPAAVLLGYANEGTMAILDLNVGLLQAQQVNGLAVILGSLMSKAGFGSANKFQFVTGLKNSKQTGASASGSTTGNSQKAEAAAKVSATSSGTKVAVAAAPAVNNKGA